MPEGHPRGFAQQREPRWGCHRRVDRSFQIRGRHFPVCARCTGLYLGLIGSCAFAVSHRSMMSIGFACLLALPTTIDGTGQAMGAWESTNLRRLWTGILGGLALSSGLVFFASLGGRTADLVTPTVFRMIAVLASS